MKRLKLIPANKLYEQQIMEYRAEMLQNGDSFDGCAGLESVESCDEWLDFDGRLKKKYGDQYVPSEVYLAVRISDDRLVGIMDYRSPLSDFLLKYGGNIGYSVRPSDRGNGYAREMLAELCRICRDKGAKQLLLTCDKDNIASMKTITSNGGVLENEVADEPGLGSCGIIQRYWITLEDN